MATIKEFTDLEIWKLSRIYCDNLYRIFSNSSWNSNYPLRNQLDKASGSIMDNIAEGFDRGGNREFIQFLSIAKASCGETVSQLYRALDRKLLTSADFERLKEEAGIIKAKIGAFMNYLLKTDKKGYKYN